MTHLFTPLQLRGVTCRNRVFVSPMCQYSSQDGFPTDWHLVHLGSRAVGGAGMVMMEATAVTPDGRISPDDMGIWSDDHAQAISRIARFVREQGAVAAIQLARAGRKASTSAPWVGGNPVGAADGGWPVSAPSAIPFGPGYQVPHALTAGEIDTLADRFADAARRALAAGFEAIEIHSAHGYLLHQFLSPLSNQRTDESGGSFDDGVASAGMRTRRARGVARSPPASCSHLGDRLGRGRLGGGGFDRVVAPPQAGRRRHGRLLQWRPRAGGENPVGPGYQTPFASAIRKEAGVATAAVGLVTSPEQAEQIVATGQADAVLLAREMLRNPYWPMTAARRLGADVPWPRQYERARRV